MQAQIASKLAVMLFRLHLQAQRLILVFALRDRALRSRR